MPLTGDCVIDGLDKPEKNTHAQYEETTDRTKTRYSALLSSKGGKGSYTLYRGQSSLLMAPLLLCVASWHPDPKSLLRVLKQHTADV